MLASVEKGDGRQKGLETKGPTPPEAASFLWFGKGRVWTR